MAFVLRERILYTWTVHQQPSSGQARLMPVFAEELTPFLLVLSGVCQPEARRDLSALSYYPEFPFWPSGD